MQVDNLLALHKSNIRFEFWRIALIIFMLFDTIVLKTCEKTSHKIWLSAAIMKSESRETGGEEE